MHTIEPGDDEQQPTHEPIECVDAADLLKRTPPERIWQVLDRIPGDDVTLLNGDGGEGKTTLALQLAFCTTVGFPWIGHEVRQGPAIYFSAEEPIGELHYRLEKLNRAVQTAEARRDRLTLISRAGKDLVLATFRNGIAVPSALLLELVAIVRREQPVLLVLDAAADVFGGDEIRRSDVRAFINLLRGQLALPNKCAVVLLGHPSREGIKTGDGYSGSTHWNNSVRGRLYLTSLKDGDADVRVLEVMKNNRGKRGEKAHLRWSDGFFTTLTDINAVDAATKAKAKSVMLDLVGRYEKQGRSVNANPSSTRHYYAPVVLAADPAAEGITEELFKLAMKELLHENRLNLDHRRTAIKTPFKIDRGEADMMLSDLASNVFQRLPTCRFPTSLPTSSNPLPSNPPNTPP